MPEEDAGQVKVRRGWLLSGTIMIIVAAGTAWLLSRGSKSIAIAAVLTLTMAALALAVQVFGVPWQESPIDDATLLAGARRLAGELRKRESAEQNRFLADSGAVRAANVRFASAERVSWPHELVTWRSDSDGLTGSLEDIADFYRGSSCYPGLTNGRLIILGVPGAGKTVLANQLLLDLVSEFLDRELTPDTIWTIPVRLSLPAFDPGTAEECGDSNFVASRLEAWIARQLAETFGVPFREAASLIDKGWILPILDGLDEMDTDQENAPRAAAVGRALNTTGRTGLRRVVITCRNSTYEQLAATTVEPGREAVLQDATVVELQPLSTDEIITYLIRRFPDPAEHGRVQPRWQPILDRLTSQPDSPLAKSLGSPLRLFMAVTSYHQRDTQPAELLSLSTDELGIRLFDRLIPAVTFLNTAPSHTYSGHQVRQWLSTLAHHLEAQQRLYGRSGSDLELHMLWTAAGYRLPRLIAAAIRGVLIVIPLLIAAGLYIHISGHLFAPDLSGRLTVIVLAVWVLYTIWRESKASMKPHVLALSRIRFRTKHSQFPNWVAIPVTGGVVIALIMAITISGLVARVAIALLYLMIWVTITGWADQTPSAIDRPTRLIRQGWSYDVSVWICAGLGLGLFDTLALRTVNTVAFDFALGLATGFAFGGMLDAKSPWLRYFVATQILARRHQLPVRPARFMDWAYSAGLLRLSGTSVQFRHRELQDRLCLAFQQNEFDVCTQPHRSRGTRYKRDRPNALVREASRAHLDRGVTLASLGRHQEALSSYDQGLNLTPDNPSLHFNKGEALFMLSRFSEAEAELLTVIRLRPKDILGAAVLFAAIAWPDDTDKARMYLDAALSSPGKLLTPCSRAFYRAIMLAILARTDEAIATFKTALDSVGDEPAFDDDGPFVLERFRNPAVPGISAMLRLLEQGQN